MDFSLDTFKRIFSIADEKIREYKDEKNKEYKLFAFFLATEVDNVKEIINHYDEISMLSGGSILFIAPFFKVHEYFSNDEIIEILRKEKTKKDGNVYSYSDDVDEFLNKQMKETYDFSNFIDLEKSKIPCIVFFDDLSSPERYVCWSLRGLNISQIISELRSISDLVNKFAHIDNTQSGENYEILQDINILLLKKKFVSFIKKIPIPFITTFINFFK